MIIEPIKVPPGAEVFRRRTPVLHNRELSKVSKYMVCQRAPPLVALSVDTDPVMWRTKGEQGVNLQVSTPLNNSSSDKTTLRDAHDVDFFASVVRIVM